MEVRTDGLGLLILRLVPLSSMAEQVGLSNVLGVPIPLIYPHFPFPSANLAFVGQPVWDSGATLAYASGILNHPQELGLLRRRDESK